MLVQNIWAKLTLCFLLESLHCSAAEIYHRNGFKRYVEDNYNKSGTTSTKLISTSLATDVSSSAASSVFSSTAFEDSTVASISASEATSAATSKIAASLPESTEASLSVSTTTASLIITKTHTIFCASTTPTSLPQGTLNTELEYTKSNPVGHNSDKLSATLSYTIDVSKITKGCTVTGSSSVAPVASSATSTAEVSYSPTGFTTSYISATSGLSAEDDTSSITTSSSAPTSGASSTGDNTGTITASPSAPAGGASSISDATSTISSGSTIDLFKPISTDKPPTNFSEEDLEFDLPNGVDNDGNPIETNKFYVNLFLGSQASPVFTYPYVVWYEFSSDEIYGLAISHTTADQYTYGYREGASEDGPASYYINPGKINQLTFSADAFDGSNVGLKVSNLTDTSALATLYDNSTENSNSKIDFPLVQGMGFITGVYSGDFKAQLQSQVGIYELTQETADDLPEGTLKYKAKLNNQVTWLVYATLPDGSSDFDLSVDNSVISANNAVDGLVLQVAVAPESDQESYYDSAAGLYVTHATVSGYADGDTATYKFAYDTEGSSNSDSPIVFALPHHIESFTSETANSATNISLQSTTKGLQYAYVTDTFEFNEKLDAASVGFLPYTTLVENSGDLSYTSEQLSAIASAANDEFSEDIVTTIKGFATYTAGKYIDKFSYILLVSHKILQDEDFTKSALSTLQEAFDAVFNNELHFQLFYDTKFKGVTSNAVQVTGDPNEDFGGSYYNDHHFHYGYFIHAAAVVGYVDAELGGTWAKEHKDFINALARDVNNPSSDDQYFPISRSFDWYHGHSWAAGLFESADGRNQESTSEDYNFAYGLKLWGKVIGDETIENRANLILSIMKRSLNDYYLYSDDNDVEPEKIIGNKVAGILFDNKVDYTTFFGLNKEYIHGIHMLPVTPISSLIRGPEYTQQEWNDIFADDIESIQNSWTGTLRLNQALFDPKSSYEFFSADNFNTTLLDDGQSLTWCLAYSAGINNLNGGN